MTEPLVLPLAPALPDQPASVTQTDTTSTVQTVGAPGWLSTNLRNLIALAMTAMVCYLALGGNHDAQIALVASFSVLMGAIWGERAALKTPGRES
jgi:hypothetical protein